MSQTLVSQREWHTTSVMEGAPASAGGVDRHAILTLIAALLVEATTAEEAVIFEGVNPANPLDTNHQTASAPGARPSAELVRAFLHATQNPHTDRASTSVRFHRADDSSAHLLKIGLAAPEGTYLGYVALAQEPAASQHASAQRICAIGTALLAQLREMQAKRQLDAGAESFQKDLLDALQLGADAYWEADAEGIIRRVVVLHARETTQALCKLEGKALFSKASDGERASRREFRGSRMELRSLQGKAQMAELSGKALADGSWHGIARLVPQTGLATSDQARTLIAQIETARDHEAALRRETEVILDGLRIITSGKPGREIFQELLKLLAPVLEFRDSVILQREWSGRISATAGSGHLLGLDWQEEGQRLFAIDEVAAALSIPDDCALPPGEADRAYGSALVVKLKSGSKATVLLCLHPCHGFYATRHLGLGARLSLVASQAFLNEEERQKVVDASKLATMGEMAAGIVHEINQPLTTMTLGVNNLLEALELQAEPDKAFLASKLTRLHTQIDRISKIVSTMRVLSRRSDGTLQPFAVGEVVRSAADIIQHKLALAKIKLDIPIDEQLHATGNPLEFSQVVLNLLSNAHDAILDKAARRPDDDVRQITVTAAPSGEWVELSVRDTGPGFPKQRPEAAFEPFFTTKPAGKGTGLGLALSRRIVENMGGSIALQDCAHGADVRVRLKPAPPSTS